MDDIELDQGCIFLSTDDGIAAKVSVRKVVNLIDNKDVYEFYGDEWEFLVSQFTLAGPVSIFHFRKLGWSYFNVIAFAPDGMEYQRVFNGENFLRFIVQCNQQSFNLQRVDSKFFEQFLDPSQTSVSIRSPACTKSVELIVQYNHELRRNIHAGFQGSSWGEMFSDNELTNWDYLLLSRLNNSTLKMVVFDENWVKKKPLEIDHFSPDDFDNLVTSSNGQELHRCKWGVDHRHLLPSLVFYKELLDFVFERNRLTIPAYFVRNFFLMMYKDAILKFKNMKFRMEVVLVDDYCNRGNASHVFLKGDWRAVQRATGSRNRDMLMFQLLGCIDGELTLVFDIC